MSPLTRTLETAAGVFGAGAVQNGQSVLMLGKTGTQYRTPHDAIVLPERLPFVANINCRERVGEHSGCSCSTHG